MLMGGDSLVVMAASTFLGSVLLPRRLHESLSRLCRERAWRLTAVRLDLRPIANGYPCPAELRTRLVTFVDENPLFFFLSDNIPTMAIFQRRQPARSTPRQLSRRQPHGDLEH